MRSLPARLRPPVAPSAAAWQTGVTVLKLVAGGLAGATAAVALANHQGGKEVAPALTPARNETVVYRQAPTRSETRLGRTETLAAQPAEAAVAYYPPAVQTVRFVNPDPGGASYRLAALTSEPRPMTKVGGFVAFPGRQTGSDSAAVGEHRGVARPGFPRKRAMTPLAEVDEYLWEVYQRSPIKKDGSGDFTWKDPAAAERMGLSLRDYVIVGMDPDFREQLYHAGHAMDAAGVQWAMLSAFRDDYRQKIAAGFKASGGNSLHGGSRRTGGYGHGRAVDVTSTDGDHSAVWRWLDAHGAKFGLYRPMPGIDPAHVQSKGEWRKLAQSMRLARTRIAEAPAATAKAAAAKTKVVAADTARR